MDIKEIKKYVGSRKVKVVLKNRYSYEGSIGDVTKDYVKFVDKYGMVILIDVKDISAVEIKKER